MILRISSFGFRVFSVPLGQESCNSGRNRLNEGGGKGYPSHDGETDGRQRQQDFRPGQRDGHLPADDFADNPKPKCR